MGDKIQITDHSDLRKYRTEIPNMADDELGPYQMRLYVHYKRVCGAAGGTCWQSVRTTATICKMSAGQVVKVREQLRAAGWITVAKNERGTLDVTIIDRWPENFARFAKRSPHDQGVHPMNGHRSPHETKNKPLQEKTRKKKAPKAPTPPAVNEFRKATHRFPAKSWYEEIAAAVGEDEAALSKWYDICRDWVGSGWNATNVKGMLDVFRNGWNANGATPGPRQAVPTVLPDKTLPPLTDEEHAARVGEVGDG